MQSLTNATKGGLITQRQMEILRRLERQYIRRELCAIGLTVAEGMVLYELGQEGQTRQEDIARCFSVDKGMVARAVARLEGSALVTRQVSDRCRREKVVTLTEAGRRASDSIQEILNRWDRIVYQGFTPEEQSLFNSFLTRMTENATEFKRRENWNG